MWCSSMAVRTCGATGCWWQPVGARASRRSAWRRSVSRPTPTGSRLTSTCAPASALWAIGDVNGIWPLTHVGEYEGDVVAANISGDARPANYEAVPLEVLSDTIQPFPSFSGIYDAAVVNLIAAGFVDTPLSASLLGDRLDNGGTETARRGERRSHDWETSRPTQAGGPGARQRRHPARL